MATGLEQRIIRGPGRLIIGPTNLSSPSTNYGGTEVGNTKMFVLTSFGEQFVVQNESLGAPTDILAAPKAIGISCLMRGWDDDAVNQFLISSVGTISLHRKNTVSDDDSRPGASVFGTAVILLYVPDDPIHVPSLLAYVAIPMWDASAQMAWDQQDELTIPISFKLLQGTSKYYEIGILSDLSLTS